MPAVFDFITDDEFRMGLESDLRELTEAFGSRCWKTVHVLAGSVIEAVLIDYLSSTDYLKRTGKDPHKLDLSQAISACVSENVLSQKAADLANVIRQYRNLIHPGRVLRLGETVDEDSATVAKALVSMVVNELAMKKRASYGYTAEQIVSKIERDPSGVTILGHLLRQTKDVELTKLLVSVLPTRYREIYEDDEFGTSAEVLEALESAFRIGFNAADEGTKFQAMQRYVKLLKEAGGSVITQYEDAFLLGHDLAYLTEADREMVKKRLLSRLGKEKTALIIAVVEGLAKYLHQEEVNDFVDPLVRLAIWAKTSDVKSSARSALEQYPSVTSAEQDKWISQRLEEWARHVEGQHNAEAASFVRQCKAWLPDEIEDLEVPF